MDDAIEPVELQAGGLLLRPFVPADADAVFNGTLVEVITPSGDTFSSSDPERFVFEVDEVYKGEVAAR